MQSVVDTRAAILKKTLYGDHRHPLYSRVAMQIERSRIFIIGLAVLLALGPILCICASAFARPADPTTPMAADHSCCDEAKAGPAPADTADHDQSCPHCGAGAAAVSFVELTPVFALPIALLICLAVPLPFSFVMSAAASPRLSPFDPAMYRPAADVLRAKCVLQL